jgi:hypothetical protein
VRLACLSHAASVQAEPGSNSSIEFTSKGPSPPHAHRHPRQAGSYVRLTVSGRGGPRGEFVQPTGFKTFTGQRSFPRHSRRLGRDTAGKAQTHLSRWLHNSRRPWMKAASCVLPQRCAFELIGLMAPIQPPMATAVHRRRHGSHPRDLRLFTCQRALRFYPQLAVDRISRPPSFWGGESYRAIRSCQLPVRTATRCAKKTHRADESAWPIESDR